VLAEKLHTQCPEFLRLGFSLNVRVRVGKRKRRQLEQLIRYTTRPPLANENLTQGLNKNTLYYKLKRPFSNGKTHAVFTPFELNVLNSIWEKLFA